jgi:poly-beta-hydroxyalkanoate depolymerase
VLVVAPLSDISQPCCATRCAPCSADFDVYLTDWHNARDVPLDEGAFGFDEYVDDVIERSSTSGPVCTSSRSASHACQPRSAVMAQGGNVPPA